MFIDTHAHLYAKAFSNDRTEMINRAIEAGIEQILLPNIDASSIEGMLALEEHYPDRCFAMMGLHPCSVKENYEEELAIVEEWWKKRDFIAVGEIGIDLYWDKTFVKQQQDAFLRQATLAIEHDRPIVIHARDSLDMLIELVQGIKEPGLRGVFHCFTGNVQQAQAIIDQGFYLGLGGVLTFKNSGLDKTVADLSLEHFVLETDAPYLSPTPYRGKRNESAYVSLVADKLASIKGVSKADVATVTTTNASKLFGLPVLSEKKERLA